MVGNIVDVGWATIKSGLVQGMPFFLFCYHNFLPGWYFSKNKKAHLTSVQDFITSRDLQLERGGWIYP